MSRVAETDVAIIGMGGRFPGADDVDRFWRNLCEGVESIRRFTDQELREAGIPESVIHNPAYVKASPLLEDVEGFDAGLFGINPSEAELMDPQQRLFMETSWHALENAGYPPGEVDVPTGVFGGAGLSTYLFHNLWGNNRLSGRVLMTGIGNENDYVATRVGYHLNLRGPCVSVQSACSTSLVAVHLACQALIAGECEMAVAGGVTVALPLIAGYTYQEGLMLSPDGHCRAFDADSGGTIFSRGGVAAVVLKRLEDALEDGDTVVAVVKGSAINNDGSRRAGFAAPGVQGQSQVITEALAVADVDPDSIGYVEAHGTGTSIGDPIEVAALTRVYRRYTERRGYCALGSLKTNVGHLNRAAGVAGLIKAALAVREGVIPPTLHFRRPNPQLELEESPFFVNADLLPWERNGAPRRAGVSSFGVGGTNAHAVVEEPPAQAPTDPGWPRQLLVLSARNEEPLERMAENLAGYLEGTAAEDRQPDLADVAWTLQVGRKPMAQRLFAVAGDPLAAAAALREAAGRKPATAPQEVPSTAFLFPGQGAQYPGMAAELYAAEETFRQEVDGACEAMQEELGLDLRELLFPAEEDREAAAERLEHTALTQPALFVVEHALARQWQRWGVEPEAMLGHSLGEYVAACLAGVFSLEDGLGLVVERGRLMGSAPTGAMLSVSATEEAVRPYLEDGVELSVVNGPSACVLGGTAAAIDSLRERLEGEGLTCRRLHTSHAFHCSLMDPILEPFRKRVAAVELSPPRIPFVSNRTGTWITDDQATSPDYWVDHLRHTVRFGDGVATLLAEDRVVLEVGPGGVLGALVRRHPAGGRKRTVVPSLPPARKPGDDLDSLLAAVGSLWSAGLPIDWRGLQRGRRRRVPLPGYAFEHRSHWIDPAPRQASQRPKAVKRPDVADWFYVPSWRPSLLPVALGREVDTDEPWLVFADDDPTSRAVLGRLADAGAAVVAIRPGDGFAPAADGTWTVRPGNREDLGRLVDELGEGLPRRILHLWAADPAVEDPDRRGFFALLALGQALEERELGDGRRVTVLTRHLQPVEGGEPRGVRRATLMGPCRVLPNEIPGFIARAVDVDAEGEEVVDLLLAEVQSGADESFVIWRDGRRRVLGHEPVRLGRKVPDRELPLRKNGVYLVTGGFGGLGHTVARMLARTAGARLVLLGRTALPDRERWDDLAGEDDGVRDRVAQVRELEALGAEVLPVAADVTDRGAVARAVEEARRRFGAVHGVFHTAGRAGVGRAVNKSEEAARGVLAPKVDGTLNLAEALTGDDLDFLVLFSSIISVVGPVGQVDYSGANCFLDVFAHQHTVRHGVRTLALDWDVWSEVGMAVRMQGGRPAARPAVPSSVPELHAPLDLEPAEAGKGETAVAVELAPDRHWLLAEHRVKGVPVMPGTGLLELAFQAVDAARRDEPVELRDVVFLQPLAVPEGATRPVRVVLQDRWPETAEFRIEASGDAGWDPQCTGRVAPAPGEAPRLDLEALEAVHRRRVPDDELRRGEASEQLVWWGPRWSAVRSLEVGENDLVARLELPDAYAGDLEHHHAHPSLLDLATGLSALLVQGGPYLPMSYHRVRVFRSFPARLVSHMERKGKRREGETVITFDVTLADEAGAVVAEVEGFAMSRAAAVAVARAGQGRAGKGGGANLDGILPSEGVTALRVALARAELPQLVISPRDVDVLTVEARVTGHRLRERAKERQKDLHPRPKMSSDLVAPRNRVEEQLAEIWQDVLGIDEIGVEDDFLELGGDSVVGIQIVSRARALGLEVSPDLLFEQPTVARLAAALDEEVGPEDGVAEPEEAGEPGHYPATPLQRAMVEHPGAAPGSRVYRLEIDLRFDSRLPAEVVARAWNRLVEEEPVLRTTFRPSADGGLEQVVHAPEPVEVPFHDWSGTDEVQERWEELLGEQLAEGLDPSRLPLVRPVLVRTGTGEDRLLITAHHAVMDGWSIGALFERMAHVLGSEPSGPALPFRRLVEARRQDGGDAGFWREQLAGTEAGRRLPASLAAADGAAAGHGLVVEELDDGVMDRLVRGTGVSVATAVLGAWSLALAREAGALPVVGVVFSGRSTSLPGVESAVGLYINRLPLAVPTPEGSLADWLQELQAVQRRLQAQEQTPLPRVEEWCGGGPLFESLFRFQNFPLERLRGLPGLRHLDWRDAWPHPLDLEVRPRKGLSLRLGFDRSRVDGAAAERLLSGVGELLVAMATEPDAPPARWLEAPVVASGRLS